MVAGIEEMLGMWMLLSVGWRVKWARPTSATHSVEKLFYTFFNRPLVRVLFFWEDEQAYTTSAFKVIVKRCYNLPE